MFDTLIIWGIISCEYSYHRQYLLYISWLYPSKHLPWSCMLAFSFILT